MHLPHLALPPQDAWAGWEGAAQLYSQERTESGSVQLTGSGSGSVQQCRIRQAKAGLTCQQWCVCPLLDPSAGLHLPLLATEQLREEQG
jgi:hypothetical protein